MLLTQHTTSRILEDEGKVDVFLTNLTYLRAGKPLENLVNLSPGY